MRSFILLLLLGSLGRPAASQLVAPGRLVFATDTAKAQLDSISRIARETRKEQAACLVTWMVDANSLVLMRFAPVKSRVESDSIHIDLYGPPCERWQSMLHVHVITMDTPSGQDYHTVAQLGQYGLLLSAKRDSTWSLKPYP